MEAGGGKVSSFYSVICNCNVVISHRSISLITSFVLPISSSQSQYLMSRQFCYSPQILGVFDEEQELCFVK
jgi:hypothetical protein